VAAPHTLQNIIGRLKNETAFSDGLSACGGDSAFHAAQAGPAFVGGGGVEVEPLAVDSGKLFGLFGREAGKGDALANRVYDFTGKLLGEACANFMTFSSPEAFIFFGGLTKAGDLLMKPLVESYNETVLPIYKNKAKFLISGLEGSSAAVLGASAVGWEL